MTLVNASAVPDIDFNQEIGDGAARQVIFIENTLDNWQKLAGLLPASAEVVILDGREDGLAQMARYLSAKPAGSVDSLQLLSHGSMGEVQLGSLTLTMSALQANADSLRQIGQALSDKADWQIYGCDVASGAEGRHFIDALARLTGADVSASVNRTGQGGDWALEAHTGAASAAPDWVARVETDYRGALAITHNFESGDTITGASTSVLTLKNNTSNVSIMLTAAQGVWKAGNDASNGYSTTFSGNWGLNEAGSSTNVTLTVDMDNNGSFGDAFSFNSFKLSDPSFNGGLYVIKPNGSTTGQETILLNSMIDSYSTFSPTTSSNFNNITSLSIDFSSSATGIAVDDFDIGAPAAANTAPTITSGAIGSVNENASTSTVVYAATATDAENDAIIYALTGADAGLLTINSSTGVMRLLSSANYEAKSSYSVNVLASDGSLSSTKAVTININDVNETPTYSSGASGSVAENAATTTVAYTAAATDPEGGAITYSLSGTDAASFNINSGTGAIRLNASANYEAKSSYSLNVLASDGVNTGVKAITIAVTNVNEKPEITAPASQNVDQETATALTGISVADPDSGSNMITVSLSAPAGSFTATSGSGVTALGSGASSLTLTGTQTNINAFISASKATYTSAAGATGSVTLSIGSNDGGNSGSGGTQTDVKTETLNIVAPGSTPVITSGVSGSIAENAATSTVAYTAAATDADNDTLTYALTGADAAAFLIDASTGAVTLAAAADYETKSSYSITVNASDASHTATRALTINVTDVNEAPTNIALSASNIAENTDTSSAVNIGLLTSTDPDVANTFSYSIVGGADQASFQVTGAALQFKAGAALDYETKSSYAVTVRSTDQGGQSYDKAFAITLTNANDKPELTTPASQSVTLGAATALSGISVSDQDAGANAIALTLSAAAGVLTAATGGGVTIGGSGSAAVTLSGSQSAINTFLTGGGVTYAPDASATAGSTVTLTVQSDDNGFTGGAAQTVSTTIALTLAAAGGGGGGTTDTLIDGVHVAAGFAILSDGSIVPTTTIPVITGDRHDQDSASAAADIPLAGGAGAPVIKAEIPVGIGMTSEGGDGAKADKTDLIAAIESRTVDKSADQNAMVELGHSFLKALPASTDLWVRTVIISADSNKDAAGNLVFRGQTSDSDASSALVLDFSHLPKNSKVSTENINFAAVVGEVNITTGDGDQLLIADDKSQTLDLGAGDDTVYAGAGDDVLNNSKGDDKLFGQDGDDTFGAENGKNTLHGGAGDDMAKFTGSRSDYTIEHHDGYVKVINNTDPSKTTLLINTETLQFADTSETVPARDALDVLAGAYMQIVDRQADLYGFECWANLQSSGASLGSIAIKMIRSDEARAHGFVLNGDAGNDVEMLYKALLGRESDSKGKAAWTQQLQSGALTLEQVADAFMLGREMQTHYLTPTEWDFFV
ncbi:hypothetical protein M2322_003955 [Rhodoblastus acidophilus]|uniref:DUF4347 domain-containing protein n=1 Tax=Rhodoblastus acidophilus TaxID=1074 RepID=UPI002225A2A7|nr:DUF4347 domain-containing protein [Rhodoblastus acidophilus]MCW2318386.1 hypothetical protein [Rhodoblastus acidophilus]